MAPSHETEYFLNQQNVMYQDRPFGAHADGMTPPPMHRIPRKPVNSVSAYQAVATGESLGSFKESDGVRHVVNVKEQTRLSLLRVWWQEILACCLVIGAFAAILATLFAVHTKPLPRLPFHVSVNTLIAIFATVLKVAAAFVLAEGLSQSKWSWYQKPRRLHDFLVYDNASRGPWGAVQLIWYLRCRPFIASLGAFVTIAATLVDPLSQQLIRIYDCRETISGETASLPRTQLFDEHGGHIGASYSAMSLGFIGSLATGQFSSSPPQVPFTCRTGNCTFEHEYSSVGYCSSCTDVSHDLVFENLTSSVSGSTFIVTVKLGTKLGTVLSFEARDTSQQGVRFSMVYSGAALYMAWFDELASNGTEPRGHTYKCLLNPCMSTFRARVLGGRLSEEVINRGPDFGEIVIGDSYMAKSMVDLSCVNDATLGDLSDVGYVFDSNTRWLPYNVTVNPDVPETDNTRYSTYTNMASIASQTEAGEAKGFYQGNATSWTLSNAGRRIVPHQCIYQIYYEISQSLEIMYFYGYFKGNLTDNFYGSGVSGSIVPLAVYNAGAANDSEPGTLDGVRGMLQNITDSMTTYMRWHGNKDMSEPVVGLVQRNAVCIEVRWGYLAYSAAFSGLSLVFFIAMASKTRATEASARSTEGNPANIPVHHDFKSSALATIFHGLDRPSHDELQNIGASNTVSELEDESKNRFVTMVLTDHGWKLSNVHQT